MGQSSSSEANPAQEEARPRIVVARELEGALSLPYVSVTITTATVIVVASPLLNVLYCKCRFSTHTNTK
jgi:hypothetical protein